MCILTVIEEMNIVTGRENVANAKCSKVQISDKTRIIVELLGDQAMVPYGVYGSGYRRSFGTDIYQIDSISSSLSFVPFKQEVLDGKTCWVAQEDIYRKFIINGVQNGEIPKERLPEVVNDIIGALWFNLSHEKVKSPFLVRIKDSRPGEWCTVKCCNTLQEAKTIYNELASSKESYYQDIAILKYHTEELSYHLALLD